MEILTSEVFLKSIIKSPDNVRKSLIQFIRNVKNEEGYLRASGERVENRDYFRIHIAYTHRLFYKIQESHIVLLDIRKKSNNTYKNLQIIDNAERSISSLDNLSNSNIDPEYEDDLSSSSIIQIEELERSSIPKKYWDALLRIKKEDELFDIGLSDDDIEYIIDNFQLYSSIPIEDIENTGLYSSSESELDQYLTSKIKLEEYILRNLELSEQQKNILEECMVGPILVKGGPGTGKSILALYQVKKLFESGKKKILFTTHNEALAAQSRDYLKALIGNEFEASSIDVKTVTEVAKEIYISNHGEYRICDDQQAKLILDSAIDLIDITNRFNRFIHKLGKNYIIEEFNLVIDARGIKQEVDYIDNPRFGRDQTLNNFQRKNIWKLYEKWKNILKENGLITAEQLKNEVLTEIESNTPYSYNHIIVDEAQDLSPVSLKLLFNLAPKEGFYLTADTDQSLYQRSFSWNHIRNYINFKGETRKLNRCFRSVYEVWRAYNNIVPGVRFSQSRNLSGSKPELLYTDDLTAQVKHIKEYLSQSIQEYPDIPRYAGVILVPNSDYGQLLSSQLNYHGLSAQYVNSREQHGLSEKYIKIMAIQETKGLEFPFVIVAGLREGILPPDLSNNHTNEAIQIRKQHQQLFYVACSRATKRLLVCASKSTPSSLLENINRSYWSVIEA